MGKARRKRQESKLDLAAAAKAHAHGATLAGVGLAAGSKGSKRKHLAKAGARALELLRQRIDFQAKFAAHGYTMDRLVEETIAATKMEMVSRMKVRTEDGGEEVQAFVDPDGRLQLAAREQIMRLVGVGQMPQETSAPGPSLVLTDPEMLVRIANGQISDADLAEVARQIGHIP